jgi:hypothetical protein
MAEQTKQSVSVLTIRRMLIILCGLAFFLGVRYSLTVERHPADLLLVWAMDILTIFICAQDARQRGRILLHSYRWIMFFTWPISILVYYILCRGLKGLGLVFLWGLILSTFYIAGGLIVLGFLN